ncbi:MAG: GNAT family N-acetyltransferase [Ruminococcaceae bacterium]|nr:GNAT family N-acetyltransferase [Oscillospiraceae bacterium]
MTSQVRGMRQEDREAVLSMMREFYASPAVYTCGSEEIFCRDIDACLSGSPYLEGFVIESENEIAGYAMIAKSFSTEFGKPCIWIEDLYLKEAYRARGLGNLFFDYLTARYTDCIFRLEVEDENESAIRLYEKRGFTVLPYKEMKAE